MGYNHEMYNVYGNPSIVVVAKSNQNKRECDVEGRIYKIGQVEFPRS